MPPCAVGLASFDAICARLRLSGCVYAEEEAQLLIAAASNPAELMAWVDRRVAGYPLEHVVGWAEFCGLRIELDAGVFVPRSRTELVVNEAIALLQDPRLQADRTPAHLHGTAAAVVVDLCCGSGAVGVAIAARIPGIELHATDVDPAAFASARRNLAPVGGTVHSGDLFDALPLHLKGKVQVLAVNAPYVPTGAISTMPQEARLHENRVSLDGGPDGLAFHRRIAGQASEWLVPGGGIVIETSQSQAARTAAILSGTGLSVRTVHSDELDGTVVVGHSNRAA